MMDNDDHDASRNFVRDQSFLPHDLAAFDSPMNASESTVITTHTSTILDPLESLQFPHVDESLGQKSLPSERDSIAGSEFNDIVLDDDSYSTVPSAAQPAIPESYSPQLLDEAAITVTSPSRFPSLSLTLSIPKSHRKTVSASTIRSTHENNGPSLVTRLDFQEHNGKMARVSVDGQMKLQKEFARLQEKDHNQTESTIDWGKYSSPVIRCLSFYFI